MNAMLSAHSKQSSRIFRELSMYTALIGSNFDDGGNDDAALLLISEWWCGSGVVVWWRIGHF